MNINKTRYAWKRFLFCIFLIFGLIITTMVPLNKGIEIKEHLSEVISISKAKEIAIAKIIERSETAYFSIYNQNELYDIDEKQCIGYIFHLKPSGYIIVSSSRLLPPVVAYSWTTNYSMDPSNILSSFISLDLSIQLENVNQFPRNIIEERLETWDNILMKQKTSTFFQQWPPEGSTKTGGWIETTWHQNTPYNDFCPIDPKSNKRSVAGCPAIAMAQIFNYYQSINHIRFSDRDDYYHDYINKFWIDDDHEIYDFPSFPELNNYLDNVDEHFQKSKTLTDEDVAALTFACGVAAKQVYSPEVSGTFGVNQAYDAYMRFNCSNAKLYTESSDEMFNAIIDDIKQGHPVHLAVVNPSWTAGHNLIIDGYNTDGFFHLNFGWDGSYDAWYQLPLDLPFELTVIEGVIVNIMNQNTSEDLTCEGTLNWNDVKPGDEIKGSFIVTNTGEPGSLLSWQISSYPNWGNWSFTPTSGVNLSSNDTVIVNVSIIVPNHRNQEYTGGISIVNINNPSDREFIPIIIQTVKKSEDTKIFQQIFALKNSCLHWLIHNHFSLPPFNCIINKH